MSPDTLLAAVPAALAVVITAGTVYAHVVLETPQAFAGSYYKAVFKVSHGCKGSPTTAVRIRLPEGIYSAKPQPKPGWQLAVSRKSLPEPVSGPHGSTITEVVSEIAWTGGLLPNEFNDEFIVQLRLPDQSAASQIHFPVVQECETGANRWVENPAEGKSAHDHHSPAPGLHLLPNR